MLVRPLDILKIGLHIKSSVASERVVLHTIVTPLWKGETHKRIGTRLKSVQRMCLITIEVGSLHTLRLESLKLVFNHSTNFLLTNYSFDKSVRTSTLCMTQVLFLTIVYRHYFTYNSLYHNSSGSEVYIH